MTFIEDLCSAFTIELIDGRVYLGYLFDVIHANLMPIKIRNFDKETILEHLN